MQGLAGAQVEAGVMPGAPHRVADQESLGERPVVVRAMRPDREHVRALPGKHDLLVADVAEQHAAVGELRFRDALRQIGTACFGLLLGHGRLLLRPALVIRHRDRGIVPAASAANRKFARWLRLGGLKSGTGIMELPVSLRFRDSPPEMQQDPANLGVGTLVAANARALLIDPALVEASIMDDILFERRGAAGLVTLNRPQALNAVSLAMVRALTAALAEWEDDPAVTRVIVTAPGGRAFSAGRDLRALSDLVRAGRYDQAIAYFREEYALNARIKRYRKPYVALIDGIVMGGGVGISVHGSHRVAGDKFLFAMPEVGIGFFPDIGATWFLPRLPGGLGSYCALTGERLAAADATAAGIATHRVASARFPELLDALCGAVSVDAILGALAQPPRARPGMAIPGTLHPLVHQGPIRGIL